MSVHIDARSRRPIPSPAPGLIPADDRRSQRCDLPIVRLLHVAAETGARFARERIGIDPLDWLLSRKQIFEGRSAAESCQHAEGFRRATVLHGLSLGLDVAPHVVMGIPAHEFLNAPTRFRLFPGLPDRSDGTESRPGGRVALYTCSISAELGTQQVQVFCAMIARSRGEVRDRIRQRYGPLLGDEARVRIGFDWSEPLACAMVSDAMAHVLSVVAADPHSSFAHGLDFQVEQRFMS